MRAAWFALVAGVLAAASAAVAAPATPATRINFGTPGPLQTIAFADDRVRATITFRMAQDRDRNTGPAAVPPSIAVGSLSVSVSGKRRTYDLADILANDVDLVELVANASGACGADRALSRSGDYLVIQAVLTGKGCEAIARFVDLRTGRVAEPAAYDPRWLHRFDPTPERLVGTYANVSRVEAVATTHFVFPGVSTVGRREAWRFLIVHVSDATSRDRPLQIEEEAMNADDPITLSPGSRVIVAPIDSFADDRLFAGGYAMEIVQPSLADEARYDALQTPTPHDDEREIRRNLWLDWSDDAAYRGDFAGAVSAWAMMLRYDDSSYAPGEAQMLAQCRKLLARVNAGAVNAKAASAMFTNGCVPPPQR